jgi:hypothetical protein
MQEPARLISCDEAGFTGPELLNEDQPFFVYAAVDLTPTEAQAIIDRTRTIHRVQAPELKSKVLRKRSNWPRIAGEIACAAEGRALVISFDKRLNLAGKAFEYLFEPVLEDNNLLFYRNNLHRFVMNALHRVMLDSGEGVDQLTVELQEFMRSFDPAVAPAIFAPRGRRDEASIVLDCLLRFARGYASRIERRTAHLRAGESDIGKWALDLTSAAIFSLVMRGWGHHYHTIDLLCDDSKPLHAIASFFDNFVGRTDGTEITDGRRNVTMRANLARPIVFGSSAENPTLQIADILAGATADVLKNPGDPDFAWLDGWMDRHLHEDHVHPDDEVIDTRAIEPRMNLAILRELARRADRGVDPLAGMEDVYAAAYARFRTPASRLRRTSPMTSRSRTSRRPR